LCENENLLSVSNSPTLFHKPAPVANVWLTFLLMRFEMFLCLLKPMQGKENFKTIVYSKKELYLSSF
jgi:hypothetical protein